MKYNTILTEYPHSAVYQSWETLLNSNDGNEYRDYADPQDIRCRIGLNNVGSITLFSKMELQPFGVVQGFTDRVGQEFMTDNLYIVIKAMPLVNPVGTVYGYFHTLTIPTTEQLAGPITPRPDRGWLDQAR